MATLQKTACPHCSAVLKVKDSLLGKRVRCPNCRQLLDLSTEGKAKSVSGAVSVEKRAVETLVGDQDATRKPGPLPSAVSGKPSLEEAPQNLQLENEDESKAASARSLTSNAKQTSEPTLGKLGRFDLREVLGQGAFGRVYRAYDPQLDRYVALKVPTFGPDQTHKVQRFLAEAKAAAKLRHPNIVPTYESGQVDGQYFIAAQFVAGQPLSQRLEEKPPDYRQAAEWTRQLANALAYAHKEGIVHRDIKPDNIMVDAYGVPQIMDFGLAKRVNDDSAMTTDGSLLGTPAYMPPEQARGELSQVGPHSDQYSLGVVLYEMLTGQRPFEGPPHAVIAQVIGTEPPTSRSIKKDISEELEAICQIAMNKDSAERYPSCAELSADLARWLGGFETDACPLTLSQRAWRWCRRNALVAGLLASVAGLVFFGLAISATLFWVLAARTNSPIAGNSAALVPSPGLSPSTPISESQPNPEPEADPDGIHIVNSAGGAAGLAKSTGFVIEAPRLAVKPVVDGKISAGEYPPPLFVSFADSALPGVVTNGSVESDADLCYLLYAAHTTSDLFLAFKVSDDFIDAEQIGYPNYDDRIEVFIDGDRQPNDFDISGPRGNNEGFRFVAESRGYYHVQGGQGFARPNCSSVWNAGADGYVVEIRIPLNLIDVEDGEAYSPAVTGSRLRFNVGIIDNDANVGNVQTYAALWHKKSSGRSQDEACWNYDLVLAPPSAILATDSPAGPAPSRSPSDKKHIVFVTGDDLARGEEAAPQLANILTTHHGFHCTVLLPLSHADGTIDPNAHNIPVSKNWPAPT